MTGYQSIKPEVLATLKRKLPEMQEQFGVTVLGLFGSVSRGEDTADSDIDLLYTFRDGYDTYLNYFAFSEYLEGLFGRKIELIHPDLLKPCIRTDITAEAIMCTTT